MFVWAVNQTFPSSGIVTGSVAVVGLLAGFFLFNAQGKLLANSRKTLGRGILRRDDPLLGCEEGVGQRLGENEQFRE